MKTWTKGLALSGLLLAGCGGEGIAALGLGLGIGLGVGYVYCEVNYDDCYDYHYDDDHHHHAATVAPSSIATTDFDADGNLDAVVLDGADGTTWFTQGQTGGGFGDSLSAQIGLTSPRATVAVVRANVDAYPDLAILDGSPATLFTWAGDGRGGFTPLALAIAPRPGAPGLARFACGAIDGDAIDDVVTLDEAGALRVGLGTGTGAFADAGTGDLGLPFLGPDAAARLDGVFVALGAFDEAPGADVLVVDGARSRLAVLSGRGDGTFAAPKIVSTSSLGDVLGVAAVTVAAGKPAALAVLSGSRSDASAPSTLTVMSAADGSVVVAAMSARTSRSLVAVDFDRDGLTDLLLADPAQRAVHALHAVPTDP